jgi:hypothetical protein
MGYQHSKIWHGLLLTMFILPAQAQYYYNDLIALNQWERKVQTFRKEQVILIQETAILPTGEKQTDYKQSYILSRCGDTLLKNRSTTEFDIKTTYVFNSTGSLETETEIQPGMYTRIVYKRDVNGNVARIENTHLDSLVDFKDHEIHEWRYNTKNQPTQLWRIVEQFDGKFDTTTIRFLVDTNGLVTEEQTYKKKTLTSFIYYYYDEKGNLTDIVRYNEKWKRLLPDQLFEYDEKGNIIQRMQLTGSRDVSYLIWRYGFGQNGLLTEEALFNNKKEHTGSIRYSYRTRTP